jgi:hypothetical protein
MIAAHADDVVVDQAGSPEAAQIAPERDKQSVP